MKKSKYYLEFPEHEWQAGHHWVVPDPIPVDSPGTAKLIVEAISSAMVQGQSVIAILKYGALMRCHATGLPRMVYVVTEDDVGEMLPDEYYGWDKCDFSGRGCAAMIDEGGVDDEGGVNKESRRFERSRCKGFEA